MWTPGVLRMVAHGSEAALAKASADCRSEPLTRRRSKPARAFHYHSGGAARWRSSRTIGQLMERVLGRRRNLFDVRDLAGIDFLQPV